MALPIGNYLPLNLGPKFVGAASHVPLNLGVDWDYVPPEPPEPVIRGYRRDTGIAWGTASKMQRAVATGWQGAPRYQRQTRSGWGNASPLNRAFELAWGTPPRLRRSLDIGWLGLLPQVARSSVAPWSSLPRAARSASMAWRQQRLVHHVGWMPWRNPDQERLARTMPWLAQLLSRRPVRTFSWLNPGATKRTWKLPWGLAPLVPWIVLPPKPPIPPDGEDPTFPPGNSIGLNLGCELSGLPGFAPLNLGITACYAVRPQSRTYVVNNSVLVVRLPDLAPIEVDSVSISGDANAGMWTFDLNLCNPAQLPLLKPTVEGPRQIQITLNGYVWTALVESYSQRRQVDNNGAPQGGVAISGRSRTALLASPYAPLRSKVLGEARNMAQLVDEELADTTFTATYATVDWEVPAGAWYYDSTAPLDAIARLAEASGGVMQSHPSEMAVIVRPRYPTSPWDWHTTEPDATIQDDIILADSLQVRSAPLYDAVVVTGEIQGKGVTATIKRAGEAGTLFAQQASSPLINTTPAATERGRNILSDRGEQAAIEQTLPLFPAPLAPGETGLVLPLDLVEVQEAGGMWHGLCTALRIDARVDSSATVIEQTITLERHFSDAD